MIREYLEAYKDEFKRWLVDNEQGRIDIKILPYLQDIEHGFFVEAGALDGMFMTNTKILEELGWNGLLIEPSHKAAELCRKNRTALVEECALVSRSYDKPTVYGDFVFDGEYGIGAWSSIGHHAYGRRTAEEFQSFTTEVRALTLEQVLDNHSIEHIDVLSLDVEGYELQVLEGIDFEKVTISFILIEINERDYSLDEVDYLLESVGFKRIACLSNFSHETNKGWDGMHQDYLYQLK